MFFKQRSNADASLSYFFSCAGHAKAIAVDVVAGDEAWFVEQAQHANVTITHVIDTHLHADHLSGGRRLAALTNAAYCLHLSAHESVAFPFTALQDGQVLDVGNVQVKVLHTPGHTLESICLLVTDLCRGDEPWFIVTGDTLFIGAVGRPDLAGREQEMAALLFDSLHQKILPLSDQVEIYPGHQAGSLCGVGMSGKPASTLGFERRWNSLLTLTDRPQFVERLLADLPPRPAQMEQLLAINCGITPSP